MFYALRGQPLRRMDSSASTGLSQIILAAMSDKTAYSPDIRLKKQVGENGIDKHTGRQTAVTGLRFLLLRCHCSAPRRGLQDSEKPSPYLSEQRDCFTRHSPKRLPAQWPGFFQGSRIPVSQGSALSWDDREWSSWVRSLNASSGTTLVVVVVEPSILGRPCPVELVVRYIVCKEVILTI